MSTALATVRLSSEDESAGSKLEQNLQRSVLLVTSKLNQEAKTSGHRIIGVYAPSFAFNITSNGDTLVVVALCALFLQPEESHAAKIANTPARNSTSGGTKEAAIEKIIARSSQRFTASSGADAEGIKPYRILDPSPLGSPPVFVATPGDRRPSDTGGTRVVHQINASSKAIDKAETVSTVADGGAATTGQQIPVVTGHVGKSPSMRGVF